MPRASTRRPPGIRFEAQPPSAPDELPRMDVAAFVGFAASGPLDQPVLVEDVARFQALFGEDLPIALDVERGERVHAYLAPTVRAFFRNGGRRCWVVRVAGPGACSNVFPLPGLLRTTASGDAAPAHARARSEGSWSDPLLLAASLSAEPFALLGGSGTDAPLALDVAPPLEPLAGDLLRVRFEAAGYTLLLPVETVEAVKDEENPERTVAWRSSGSHPQWLRTGTRPEALQGNEPVPLLWVGPGEEPPLRLTARVADTGELELEQKPPLMAEPRPGSLLCLDERVRRHWFIVGELHPEKPGVTMSGEWVELLPTPPTDAELGPLKEGRGERLTFGLWVRRGGEAPQRLEGLGFCPSHPRYWGALPTDLAWLQGTEQEGPALPYSEPELHEALRQSALEPRFPLAAPQDEDEAFYWPLGMALLPEPYLGRVPSAEPALVRDGLERLTAVPFLDEAMEGVGTLALLAQAHFIQYQSPQPRPLKGIHSLLSKEEVTLVAVPDAVHRPWSLEQERWPEAPENTLHPLAPPTPPPEALPGAFHDCVYLAPPKPTGLEVTPASPALGQAFELSWSLEEAQEQPVVYTLEVATFPEFQDAVVLYEGPAERMTLFAQNAGTYHYRVRARRGIYPGPWSPTRTISISGQPGWRLRPAETYGEAEKNHLKAIHGALLTMCAARGDLLAVLSLPAHFREDDATGHADSLRRKFPLEGDAASSLVGTNAPSHGALYHPWPLVSEAGALLEPRWIPPDGAACGVLARRANERGAWVTPANEPWNDVVALAHKLERQTWLTLRDAQVNTLLQEPRGFVSLTASTLTADPDLEPIHVRRLLALLRRAALRAGRTYVFENDSPDLRRSVQRGFEQLLSGLLTRGAFAGSTREEAFQVVLASDPGTGSGQGRFVVELRVAPSSPLTFLNVRLVQREDRGLFTEER
ncbi:MAG TPA: hypothetical protein VFZ09_25185 [Archangium sp.]|uniref:hypothetical protein n=1 Tax=Archangium sp. TaxID=1872627 RepID=UPI002E37338F|nr:hypothetical protein [Archangium sp.]HEX5749548.1 hypothetical protein [Archangium sp.]